MFLDRRSKLDNPEESYVDTKASIALKLSTAGTRAQRSSCAAIKFHIFIENYYND